MNKIVHASVVALTFLIFQSVECAQATSSTVQSSSASEAVRQSLDIYEYMDKITPAFNKFVKDYGIQKMANAVNLYLAGNKRLIREGINTGKLAITDLQTQLSQDTAELQRYNSAVINEFMPSFKEVTTLLEQAKTATDAYGRATANVNKFSTIKEQTDALAVKYFDKVMEIRSKFKSIPALGTLRSVETILEKTVKLDTGLSDLEYLAKQPRNSAFNERTLKATISLIDLGCLINRRISAIGSETEKNTITFSKGQTITEKKLLTEASKCLNSYRLSDLLKIRDKLNSADTVFSYNSPVDHLANPIKRIQLLSDDITVARELLKQAKRMNDTGHYSQFGKMFTDGGMSLIPSVSEITAPIVSAGYNDPQARSLLSGKQLTGDVSQTYVNLLSNGLFPSDSILYIIANNAKNSISSYSPITMKTTHAKAAKESALTILGDSTAKIGSSDDSERLNNDIAMSQLQKNCEKYVDELSSAVMADINSAKENVSKIKNSSDQDDGNLTSVVSNILNTWFVFSPKFELKDNQIFLKLKSNVLDTNDISTIVFVLVLNCDVLMKSPLPLLPTSKNSDKTWIAELAKKMSGVIEQTIKAINQLPDQNQFSEQLGKLQDLKEKIDEAESRAKTLESETETSAREKSEVKEAATSDVDTSTETATSNVETPAEPATAKTEEVTELAPSNAEIPIEPLATKTEETPDETAVTASESSDMSSETETTSAVTPEGTSTAEPTKSKVEGEKSTTETATSETSVMTEKSDAKTSEPDSNATKSVTISTAKKNADSNTVETEKGANISESDATVTPLEQSEKSSDRKATDGSIVGENSNDKDTSAAGTTTPNSKKTEEKSFNAESITPKLESSVKEPTTTYTKSELNVAESVSEQAGFLSEEFSNSDKSTRAKQRARRIERMKKLIYQHEKATKRSYETGAWPAIDSEIVSTRARTGR